MSVLWLCCLCREKILIEDCVFIGINPVTMRKATMHNDCVRLAHNDLTEEQRDKYHDRIIGGG